MKKNYIIFEEAQEGTPVITSSNHNIVKFKSCLITADEKNRNGRIYPKNVLETALANPIFRDTLAKKRLCVEAGHPLDASVQRQMTVDPSNIVAIIDDVYWDDNRLMGDLETTDTSKGHDLAGLIRQGMKVAFSMRAEGAVDDQGSVKVVQPGLIIANFDFVLCPSVASAELQSIISEETQAALYSYDHFGNRQVALCESYNIAQNGLLIDTEDKKIIKEAVDFTKGYGAGFKKPEAVYVYSPFDKVVKIDESKKVAVLESLTQTKTVVLEDYLTKMTRHKLAHIAEEAEKPCDCGGCMTVDEKEFIDSEIEKAKEAKADPAGPVNTVPTEKEQPTAPGITASLSDLAYEDGDDDDDFDVPEELAGLDDDDADEVVEEDIVHILASDQAEFDALCENWSPEYQDLLADIMNEEFYAINEEQVLNPKTLLTKDEIVKAQTDDDTQKRAGIGTRLAVLKEKRRLIRLRKSNSKKLNHEKKLALANNALLNISGKGKYQTDVKKDYDRRDANDEKNISNALKYQYLARMKSKENHFSKAERNALLANAPKLKDIDDKSSSSGSGYHSAGKPNNSGKGQSKGGSGNGKGTQSNQKKWTASRIATNPKSGSGSGNTYADMKKWAEHANKGDKYDYDDGSNTITVQLNSFDITIDGLRKLLEDSGYEPSDKNVFAVHKGLTEGTMMIDESNKIKAAKKCDDDGCDKKPLHITDKEGRVFTLNDAGEYVDSGATDADME